MTCIASHHAEVPRASPPMRAATARARGVIVRSVAATASQQHGAGAIISMAVVFTAPTVPITSAQPRRRAGPVAAPIVSPMIHPSAAQGSSIDEVRDTYGTR